MLTKMYQVTRDGRIILVGEFLEDYGFLIALPLPGACSNLVFHCSSWPNMAMHCKGEGVPCSGSAPASRSACRAPSARLLGPSVTQILYLDDLVLLLEHRAGQWALAAIILAIRVGSVFCE